MNEHRDILDHVDVFIDGNAIVAIEKTGMRQEKGQVIDGKGKILMPGLINSHSHCAMSLFRNYGNDCSLQTWLEDFIWPVEAHLTGEDVYVGSCLNILEMLLSGTTTFVDMYYFMDDVARACEDLGIRALLTQGLVGPDLDQRRLKEQKALYENWHQKNSGRIEVRIGSHAIYTNTEETLRLQKKLGDQLGCGYHIHISETKKEVDDCIARFSKTPVEVYDDFGLLTDETIAAHCIWLTEKDMEILRDRKVSIAHNPASNMKLASGFMPLQKLQDYGMNIGIGTDGASSNNKQDMFREMYLASLIHKGYQWDPKAAKARTILEMATINGAKLIGREKDLGSVEVGKLADLIMVDFRFVHQTPFPEDIEAALVYSTSGSDVSMTMVNGEILVLDGHLQKTDPASWIKKAQETWERLRKR